MCKVMMFTNFRKVKNNSVAINWIANRLLKTESDGFGFVIQGKSGAYGERFVGDTNFETSIKLDSKADDSFYKMPFVTKEREVFGAPSKCNGGALFHGRISTNSLGLRNTHPINKHGWSLIHNGVVTNKGAKYTMLTDNDTEHVVEYLAKGGIDAVAKNLTGYYAAGAFDPKGNLHIMRDAIAWLYVAKIESLETFVFATVPELIEEFCEEFEYDRSTIEKVKTNSYMIFNTKGEMTDFKRFESRGYGHAEKSKMSKSLAYMGDDIPFSEHYDSVDQVSKPTGVYDASIGEGALEDYEAYRLEIQQCMDHTYSIHDWNGRTMTVDDFKMLDIQSQDECTIARPDGTLLTFEDYHTDRLASDKYGHKDIY